MCSTIHCSVIYTKAKHRSTVSDLRKYVFKKFKSGKLLACDCQCLVKEQDNKKELRHTIILLICLHIYCSTCLFCDTAVDEFEDPMTNNSSNSRFQQRITELMFLQSDTIRWECAKKKRNSVRKAERLIQEHTFL